MTGEGPYELTSGKLRGIPATHSHSEGKAFKFSTMSKWQLLPRIVIKRQKDVATGLTHGRMRKEYMYMLEEVKGMSTPFMLELKPVSCLLWMVRIERRSFARKKRTPLRNLSRQGASVGGWVSCSSRPAWFGLSRAVWPWLALNFRALELPHARVRGGHHNTLYIFIYFCMLF